jgi:hypothetical protein
VACATIKVASDVASFELSSFSAVVGGQVASMKGLMAMKIQAQLSASNSPTTNIGSQSTSTEQKESIGEAWNVLLFAIPIAAVLILAPALAVVAVCCKKQQTQRTSVATLPGGNSSEIPLPENDLQESIQIDSQLYQNIVPVKHQSTKRRTLGPEDEMEPVTESMEESEEREESQDLSVVSAEE